MKTTVTKSIRGSAGWRLEDRANRVLIFRPLLSRRLVDVLMTSLPGGVLIWMASGLVDSVPLRTALAVSGWLLSVWFLSRVRVDICIQPWLFRAGAGSRWIDVDAAQLRQADASLYLKVGSEEHQIWRAESEQEIGEVTRVVKRLLGERLT